MLTQIGSNAFYFCKNMKSFSYNSCKITAVEYEMFAFCSALEAVEIPNTVKNIKDRSFFNCNNLSSITFSTLIESIGKQAFYCCYNISNVILGDNLKHINDEAFYRCSSLKDIKFPKNLIDIGKSAFSNCYEFKEVKFSNNMYSLGESVLESCYNVVSVTISRNCKVGVNAFEGCNNLVTVYLGGNSLFSQNSFDGSHSNSISIIYLGNQDTIDNNHLLEVQRIQKDIKATCEYVYEKYCDITVIKPSTCSEKNCGEIEKCTCHAIPKQILSSAVPFLFSKTK